MKLKNYIKAVVALIGLGLINVTLAADYSTMSTEDMMNMRSQMKGMSTEDRNSFRTEMRSRVQSMSDDEKTSFQQMRGQGSGDGYGSRQGGGKYR